MTLGLITEDKNDYDALRIIINKLSPEVFDTIGAFKNGKDAIIHQKKTFCNKLTNFKCDGVIIVRDSDGRNPSEIIDELNRAYNSSPLKNSFTICLAVQEIEAWLLADISSVITYYKLPKTASRSVGNNSDEIINPKERLMSYINKESKGSQFYLTADLKRIVNHLDTTKASEKSNSFKNFAKIICELTP